MSNTEQLKDKLIDERNLIENALNKIGYALTGSLHINDQENGDYFITMSIKPSSCDIILDEQEAA